MATTKIQTLKRELTDSLTHWSIYRFQNDSIAYYGINPCRKNEEKYLRKSKILMMRIDLHLVHQLFENYKVSKN